MAASESYRAGACAGKRDGDLDRSAKVYRRRGGGFVRRVDDLPEEYEPNEWAAGYCDVFDRDDGRAERMQ